MAIESTCVDDRKCLRCHMKPAFFAIEKTLQSIPTYLVSEELHI